jgi:hypothetical protein
MSPTKIGFVAGASCPVAFGVWALCREIAYRLTLRPNTPTCGMTMLAVWTMFFFAAPVSAIIGAVGGLGFVSGLSRDSTVG